MNGTLILLLTLLGVIAAVVAGLRLVGATRLWPAGILIVTAPLEVYRTSSSAGANLSLFRLALVVAYGALAVELLMRRRRLPRSVAMPFAIYAGLVAWQVVSLLLVTANHALAYRFIGQYVAGLAAALLLVVYVERRDLRVVAGLLAGGAVLPLVAAAYRVYSVSGGGNGDLPGLTELPLNLTIEAARQGGSTLLNGTQRLNSTFADPNQFGFFIATAFLAGAGAVLGELSRGRPMRWRVTASYLALTMAAGLAVLGTYSRSAWLLAAAGVGLLGGLLGRAFWTRRRALLAGACAIAALALVTPFVISRLSTSEPGNVKSTQVHVHTMSIAVRLLEHHPLIGVGLGGYGRYAEEPPLISSAVSTFLTVGAELGIVGLVLLLAAIGVTALAAVRTVLGAAPAERMVLAGLTAAYIALAAANAIGEIWMNDFQWVLFGALVALTAQPAVRLARPSRSREDRDAAAQSPREQAPVVA